MSRNWSPDKDKMAMIPMTHITWYLGNKGSKARRSPAASPQPENSEIHGQTTAMMWVV